MGIPSRASVIAGVLAFSSFVHADTVAYDLSTYSNAGESPYQTFMSNTAVKPPELYVMKKEAGRAPGYVFVGIDGKPASTQNVPVIFDVTDERMGSLVWTGINYTEPFDFKTQTYRGQPVLTFWTGELFNGYGHGYYHVLNQSYVEIASFSPVGYDNLGDLHEFLITPNDTALVTVYVATRMDLTSIDGAADAWAFESVFQEIDIATGKLVFSWNASDHVPLDETYNAIGDAGTEDNPFDWFHINSVKKDASGDYLVSARVMNCLYKVSGEDGSIIWRMNGKKSDFAMDSAAVFAFQHDARWVDNVKQDRMTLFDNGPTENISYSRGLLLAVDQSAKTVKLTKELTNGPKTWAKFEGGLQPIDPSDPNTNYILGFGSQPFFTELNSNGDILLDVQFGVTNVVNSYRAYKQTWVGKPLTKPDIHYDKEGAKAYFSWNGATEVDSWVVYTADAANSSTWTNITTVTKTGFETTADLSNVKSVQNFVRGKAVDAQGKKLGWTDAGDGSGVFPALDIPDQQNAAATSLASAAASATSKASKTGATAASASATHTGAASSVGYSAGLGLGVVVLGAWIAW